MIDLEDRYLDQLRAILAEHVPTCQVRLFGSRAHGTARKFSDIDLAVVGAAAVPEAVMSTLRDALAESDLPYRVDVVDWQNISVEFRQVIEKQGYTVIWNCLPPTGCCNER